MRVVTVSRQFGAGGSEVAARLATSLGWSLLDNTFVERIARSAGSTPARVEAVIDRVPSLSERLADALAYGALEPLSATLPEALPATEERLLAVTHEVVDLAVARGPVVLVGRGAEAWLEPRPDACHVLCVAPREALVARVRARSGLGAAAAADLVETTNRERARFVQRHFGRAWLDPSHYHLCVNTAALGVEGAVRLILDTVARLDAPIPPPP